MSRIPSPSEAEEIIRKYNKDPFHITHAQTVSKVLGELAKKFDPDKVEYWKTVGMLHDVDFELYPEDHCVKCVEILQMEDVDPEIIRSVCSHGFGICSDVEPVLMMEKVLFATDELTGLIGAAALMRPTGISDMEVSSIKKKFKDKKFAAGCSRDVISRGAELMGVELSVLFQMTLDAMRAE